MTAASSTVGTMSAAPIVHLRRALSWRVHSISPLDDERRRLDGRGITHPDVQTFVVWRRSVLMVGLPFLALSAALAVADLGDVITRHPVNGLGVVAQVAPIVESIPLAIAAALALHWWDRPQRSTRLLTAAWVLSLVLSFVPAIVPLRFLVDQSDHGLTARVLGLGMKFRIGSHLVMELIPAAVTIPGGVMRAGLRTKSLLRASAVPGACMVLAAPFVSLLMLLILAIAVQLTGSVVLMAGAAAMAVAPWFVVSRRDAYVGAITDQSIHRLAFSQRLGMVVTTLGVALAAWWGAVSRVGGRRVFSLDGSGLVDPLSAIRSAVEATARYGVSTLVLAGLLVQLSLLARRTGQAVADESATTAFAAATSAFETTP